jgi:sigma-B regulation protein RsbU (phosphoserine phosphatase)
VTLVRTLAREQLPPDRLLQRLNDELARSNDTSMFVTIFCGYLQTNSGRLDYANAGHNPPLLVREGEAAVYHPVLPGLAAGCMEGYLYQAGMVALKLGDALLLYTDGVTEAQDSGGVFFSDRRLLEVAGSVQGESDLLVDTVLKAVEAFAGGASQADDITMLAIKYKHEKAGLAWHI